MTAAINTIWIKNKGKIKFDLSKYLTDMAHFTALQNENNEIKDLFRAFDIRFSITT